MLETSEYMVLLHQILQLTQTNMAIKIKLPKPKILKKKPKSKKDKVKLLKSK